MGIRGSKGIADVIFGLDKRIRYVAILNHQYDLLESKMREGTTSLTPAQTDREFMTIAAPVMVGAAEKLKPFCGSMRRVVVRYDRVLLVFYRTLVNLVVLSLELSADEALLDKIGSSVKQLEFVDDNDDEEEGKPE
ncbi:MAG TPA: hypothetical protein VJZ03_06040 [Candidatus Bathyarchaeia archaeon]|nr:hypothetical protein [Candidatus Bathyarchaeia archaeon]